MWLGVEIDVVGLPPLDSASCSEAAAVTGGAFNDNTFFSLSFRCLLSSSEKNTICLAELSWLQSWLKIWNDSSSASSLAAEVDWIPMMEYW